MLFTLMQVIEVLAVIGDVPEALKWSSELHW